MFRARRLLAEQGFNVMALDAPSEWGTRGIWEKQRSPEFAAHNAAAIAHARKQAEKMREAERRAAEAAAR